MQKDNLANFSEILDGEETCYPNGSLEGELSPDDVREYLQFHPENNAEAVALQPIVQELQKLMLIHETQGIDLVIRIQNLLRVGKKSGAIKTYLNDSDKLHSYPNIELFIQNNLIAVR